MDEKIIELGERVAALEGLNISDENDLNAAGRCRIYNSDREIIGCKNASSEDACAEWARWKGAWAYAWAPGYSCD